MLYSALILGLISSLHCVGMCGPIAVMLPVDHHNETKKVTQIITYHLGRLTAYATIGLIFGLLGRGFFMAGIQQKISIFIGIAMIAVVLIPEKTVAKYNFSKPVYKVISKIKSSLGSQFKKKSYKSLFIIGLLNGFLPCGMVYVALFGAIAMQSASLGVLYMLLYGLGTIPLMTIVVYIHSLLKLPFRNKIQKAIPYVTVFIGVLFILRGLGLGIPYVSPSNMSLFVQQTPNCH
ncbi:sulfite exporter TauE/SafE family protein [Flavobacterium sp. KACC 22761]|uniref:sulfite exporter TauE/SafE family protein n=1 Tax=Flavobacterium sp. KACC 22761 TaxID=3092665 RepID=UPI002A764DAC|nr:sulfite exporter TauE/SafE family protein [Flavobacterium sp. KACC 22761]WPO77460.1 sulfite exporter TauE/SafE family protein [Flavobacterium sp. KACC 22761]